ncbi:MAG TPA: NUDIX hydrolase [Candidatus Limnocylindrales bacterium]|nr:NUDIX hydrolase [Candidatus Limnocylindrales bacterium]
MARGAAEHGLSLLLGRHRRTLGVLGLVRDAEGRILVARTTYPPRRWLLPGGHVDAGERPVEAVAREVREETGISVHVERLLLTDARRGRTVILVFECTPLGGRLVPARGEIRALRWVAPEEMAQLPEGTRDQIRFALQGEPVGRYVEEPRIGR